MTARKVAAAGIAVVAVSCGTAPPEPATTADSTPVGTSSVPQAPQLQDAGAVPVATTTSEPTASGPPPPPMESSPFVAQAQLGSGFGKIFPAGKALVFVHHVHLAVWHEGEIDVDDRVSKGLPDLGDVMAVVGSWPKVHAVAFSAGARIGWGESFRYTGRSWVKTGKLTAGVEFNYVTEWDGKRALAVSIPGVPYVPDTVRLHTVTTQGVAPGPKLKASRGGCRAQTYPSALVSDSTGRIFVFGNRCTPTKSDWGDPYAREFGGPVVEWFAPRARVSTVAELPSLPSKKTKDSSYEGARVIEESDAGVLFGFSNTTQTLRFDGMAFTPGEKSWQPGPKTVRGPDATEWQQHPDRLKKREPGKQWQDSEPRRRSSASKPRTSPASARSPCSTASPRSPPPTTTFRSRVKRSKVSSSSGAPSSSSLKTTGRSTSARFHPAMKQA